MVSTKVSLDYNWFRCDIIGKYADPRTRLSRGSVAMEFSVRQSLAWMMLSQGGLFLLQFGGSVAMARLLTPYEMGIYPVASAIVGILGAIRAVGLNIFLIREPDLKPEALAISFTINAILAIVTAAANCGARQCRRHYSQRHRRPTCSPSPGAISIIRYI
jgi:hypothetical protein